MDWVRIPASIESDADRRAIAAILTAAGLEVRVVRERTTKNGTYKRYVECREQTET